MARKRVIPRFFPDLALVDWEEIYNILDDDGVQRKLPPDGHGMSGNEKAQSRLSEKDWIEIYCACENKLDALKCGLYGRDRLVREWKEHLREIMRTLDVVRVRFIGGKAA